MITLHDLDTAIAHCQGESNPNAETCKRLAAYYTIKQAMFGDGQSVGDAYKMPSTDSGYSNSAAPVTEPKNLQTIDYDSGSEFSQAIDGREAGAVLDVMDELMSVLQATNPRLYRGVMEKLYNL